MAVNYFVYELFYLGPIFVIISLPLCICFVIVPVMLLLAYLLPETTCGRHLNAILKYVRPWYMHKMVRYMFGNIFKKGGGDCEEKPQTITFIYYVPTLYIYLLAFTILQVFSLSFAVFWEKFWFEVSFSCDTDLANLDCYNFTDKWSVKSHAYINCLEEVNVSDVKCFRLVVDWSSSIGATGGIFVMSSILVTAIPWFLLEITKGNQASRKRRRIVLILQTIFILLALISLALYPILLDTYIKHYSTTQILEAAGLMFIFNTVMVTPWSMFKKINNECLSKDTRSDVNDNDESADILY